MVAGHQVQGNASLAMGRCVAVLMLPADIVSSAISCHPGNICSTSRTLFHTPHAQYDDERNEVGGYGAGQAKVSVIQQMNHDGEVNRARYMPQVCEGRGMSAWWSSASNFSLKSVLRLGRGWVDKVQP